MAARSRPPRPSSPSRPPAPSSRRARCSGVVRAGQGPQHSGARAQDRKGAGQRAVVESVGCPQPRRAAGYDCGVIPVLLGEPCVDADAGRRCRTPDVMHRRDELLTCPTSLFGVFVRRKKNRKRPNNWKKQNSKGIFVKKQSATSAT